MYKLFQGNYLKSFSRYPMELQMVHINKKYINEDGSFDESAARNDTDKRGFAIISVLFDVVPQRTWGVS